MKQKQALALVGLLASAPAMANPPAPQPWFMVNPMTSTCQRAPLSPREFDATLRQSHETSEVTVTRNDDGSVRVVSVQFKRGGDPASIDFWPDEDACVDYLNFLIKEGKLLPPDVK